MGALQEAIIFGTKSGSIRMSDNSSSIIVLNADSSVLFERTFKEHFKGLHAYACSILRDEDDAEEMVQNVFYKLWEKKERLNELDSIPAYLYRAVYNECMNFVKHEKVKKAHQQHVTHVGDVNEREHDSAGVKELEGKIAEALKSLPEQCRTIFQMSRFEELKYREIADKMGLSVKTVENQMGKALKILRTKLAEYVTVLGVVLFNLLN
ncbi:MAG: RNA polymerase sigma-70 factor [Chitinophagaceae bacterium]|nr:RNA polymerase sigma-70 factor [Chitinophagaceae bacterium]